jgi:copper chaperone CopZ/cytochrome c biogenesis protein CcdA
MERRDTLKRRDIVMKQVTYSVPNIDCERCARAIQGELKDVGGIWKVAVNVGEKRVTVEFYADRITAEAVRDQLAEAGFPPGEKLQEEQVSGQRSAEAPSEAEAPREQARPVWYWLLGLGVLILALAGYVGYVLYPRFGLPAVEGASLLLLATGAGIASFFSPCSFPLLLTLLARETGVQGRTLPARRPVRRAFTFASALSLGAAIFLLLSGLVIALGGEALFAGVTFTSAAGRVIRSLVGILLILLGLMQAGVLPFSLHAVEHVSRPLMRSQARLRRSRPLLSFVLFGFAYLLAGFG